MDLWTRHLFVGGAKCINAVGATVRQAKLYDYDKEAKYLNN